MALLVLVAYSSYSSSEIVFGSTNPTSGYDWVMTNILPQQAGLTVGSVIYRYSVNKVTEDPMLVHVQNENAAGSGYIFRSTDDWSGLPGNTINKAVSVGDIPLESWGAGSIEVEGIGTVEDPTVVYTYRYDNCFDPQSDPTCIGYVAPVNYEDTFSYVDPLSDEFIQAELARKAEIEEEEEAERKARESEKKKEKLEELLGGVNTAMLDAQATAQADALFSMNYMPISYYSSIPGGSYADTLKYQDKQLPSNKKGRRIGLAQQLLHEEMVESQYDSKSAK